MLEPQRGLSAARNRGSYEAKYDWLAYIDDDLRVYSNFIDRALESINSGSFSCIGGIYFPWYKYGCPDWLPKHVGSNQHLAKTNDLEELYDQNVIGAIMLMKKSVLHEVGGFSLQLGMNAERVGYGEEDEVQVMM